MTTTEKIPVNVYSEMTPNPETMKFVTDKMLLPDIHADFPDEASAKESPLATELFGFPFVKGVFIMNNFITISRLGETDWYEIIPVLKEFIVNYLGDQKPIFSKSFKPVSTNVVTAAADSTPTNETEIVNKIKEMLENYVKPAVEMDGGAIQFKSYNEGKVTLMLQGSCSGCPSSVITLKSGIEGLLKRMVPEVTEVVAESA